MHLLLIICYEDIILPYVALSSNLMFKRVYHKFGEGVLIAVIKNCVRLCHQESICPLDFAVLQACQAAVYWVLIQNSVQGIGNFSKEFLELDQAAEVAINYHDYLIDLVNLTRVWHLLKDLLNYQALYNLFLEPVSLAAQVADFSLLIVNEWRYNSFKTSIWRKLFEFRWGWRLNSMDEFGFIDAGLVLRFNKSGVVLANPASA